MKKVKIVSILFLICLTLLSCESSEENISIQEPAIFEDYEEENYEDITDTETDELESDTSNGYDLKVSGSEEDDIDEDRTLSDEKNVLIKEATEANEVVKYTYTDISTVKYAKGTVNVRDIPDSSGNKLGALSYNDMVSVTGQCIETKWYRIDYNGAVGYVSNNYLLDNPIADNVNTEQNSVEQNSNAVEQKNNDASEENEIHNNSKTVEGPSVTVPENEESVGNLVWVPTKGGKKYHKKSDCSGMVDPMQVSIETALANGYTACKKCY